jgi:hypothetical protein
LEIPPWKGPELELLPYRMSFLQRIHFTAGFAATTDHERKRSAILKAARRLRGERDLAWRSKKGAGEPGSGLVRLSCSHGVLLANTDRLNANILAFVTN